MFYPTFLFPVILHLGFPRSAVVKNLSAKQEMWVLSLGWEDPLKEEMTTYSSILAWEIPWTEEPGGLHTVHGVVKSCTGGEEDDRG